MVYISSCGDRWYKLTFASPTGTSMLCFSQILVVKSVRPLLKASQHITSSQPPRRIWLVYQISSGDF